MKDKKANKENKEKTQEEQDLQTEEFVDEVINEKDPEEPGIDWEDRFLRVTAEMQNVQRRANEERATLLKYRSQDLAKKVLPSLDNLSRALEVEGLTDDVRKGLEMTQESLLAALAEEGVTEIKADGAFDPNLHMAVQTVEATDDLPAGQISQVFQKGYQLHERVLRPAMVVVAQ